MHSGNAEGNVKEITLCNNKDFSEKSKSRPLKENGIDINDILLLREQGLNNLEIGKRLGCHGSNITHRLNVYEKTPRKTREIERLQGELLKAQQAHLEDLRTAFKLLLKEGK